MKVLIVTLIVVIIDQATKLLVKGFSFPFLGISHRGMYPGERINVLGEWLNISFVENPGIAFGIDFGSEYKLYLSLFTIAASAALFIYLYKMRHESLGIRLSLALVLGGAVGNLIDRSFYGIFYDYAPFLYGKVVDFIDVRMFNIFIFKRTLGNYVMNIADVAVTVGVIMLLFSFYSGKEKIDEVPAEPENVLAENKE